MAFAWTLEQEETLELELALSKERGADGESSLDTDAGSSWTALSESSSESGDDAPQDAFWLSCAFEADVAALLSQGLWTSQRRRLFVGAGRRRALCRRGEDVLVYIDAARALHMGVLPRFHRNGLSLPRGCVIPPSCIYKMISAVDGRVLFERSRAQAPSASKARVARKPSCDAANASALAAVLRSMTA